ncbi:hypothetical protein CVU83_01265 [Candidatus Falkowbacteria bacterium HGW-Falkowbacteria-2]|uniref:Uncharacterized protein n=1 Tax=Candidatus Falkowbacteria bacterium HGW-Falkowbacteria-2 TaxID=2013769 RepID=A0A2N2E1U6_9BACT|nr:MAG: hypothetical protein CVU83_01265 [Candidatus Falkowbacteria bacterium HGW-Falkowbacteria-2]
MAKKKKRSTYWFVKPLDPFTNESLANQLSKTIDVVETMELQVGDKVIKDLYLVPDYHTVSQLYSGSDRFKFKVFCRQGSHGIVSEWKFGDGQYHKKGTRKPRRQKKNESVV